MDLRYVPGRRSKGDVAPAEAAGGHKPGDAGHNGQLQDEEPSEHEGHSDC